MSLSHFRPPVGRFSADSAREAIADSLMMEQAARGLTDAEVGELAHKSRDRVLEWRGRTADMPLVCWLRLVKAWGPAFAWRPLSLLGFRLVALSAPKVPDPNALARLDLRLREIEPRDIVTIEAEIEAAGALLDHLRLQLATARGVA